MARTQTKAQQVTNKTAFGITVLKGQSIDPNIQVPKGDMKRHGYRGVGDALRSEMSGGCDAYNSIRGIVDGKVVESSYSGNDGQAAVYDIMAVERGVKEALARKGGRNVVVVDGKLTPEEARAMFKVSIVNNCG